MMKQTRHKAVLGRLFTLTAFLASISLALAQPAEHTGTLTAPAKIPIMNNGAQIGAASVPAGTKIKVLKEEAGKVLVSAPAGQAWVESSRVTQDAPTQDVTPSPTQGVVATPPNIARPATTTSVPPAANAPIAKAKKRIMVVFSNYSKVIRFNQYDAELISALKKKAEVTLALIDQNGTATIEQSRLSTEGARSAFREVISASAINPDIIINSPEILELLKGYNAIVLTHFSKNTHLPIPEIRKLIPIIYGDTKHEYVEAAKSGKEVDDMKTVSKSEGPLKKTTMDEIIYMMLPQDFKPIPSDQKMTKFIDELATDILQKAR